MNFIYLLSLKISGIKNIEKPVSFKFYNKTIKEDFDPERFRVKAIYGENGSGKTAVITGVKLLKNIIENPNYLSDRDTQQLLYNLVNKKEKKGEIEVEFYSKISAPDHIVRYRIAFEIGEDSRLVLTEETLEHKNANYSKNKYVLDFEVKNGELTYYRGDLADYTLFKEKTKNLLSRQTFVSSLRNVLREKRDGERKEAVEYAFDVTIFGLLLFVWIDDSDNHNEYFMKKELSYSYEQEDIEHIIELSGKIINNRDNKILVRQSAFDLYKKDIERMCSFIQIFKSDLRNIEIEKKIDGNYYSCNLVMVYDDYSLDSEFESRGVRKLMDLFDVLDGACDGQIAFIDELDSNINDVYLGKIIEFFMKYGKGQLCFTAHNLSPMSVVKNNKNSIDFISSINTVHSWAKHGNLTPESAYQKGFIEDSPFNVEATDFLGVLGGDNE